MNKCVNIVFILLYSETLFEGRNVYVQICKIKNKLCFIKVGFCVHLYSVESQPAEFVLSTELPLSTEHMKFNH